MIAAYVLSAPSAELRKEIEQITQNHSQSSPNLMNSCIGLLNSDNLSFLLKTKHLQLYIKIMSTSLKSKYRMVNMFIIVWFVFSLHHLYILSTWSQLKVYFTKLNTVESTGNRDTK